VSDWKFGKFTAMREIALALEGGYDFYYMGFYIHSCTKMRYKRDYSPTLVLGEPPKWRRYRTANRFRPDNL